MLMKLKVSLIDVGFLEHVTVLFKNSSAKLKLLGFLVILPMLC